MIRAVATLALVLAVVTVLLLALGPIGMRGGLWHYSVSLLLFRWSAYAALAGAALALLALLFRRRLTRRLRWGVVGALILCAICFYMPWQYSLAAGLGFHDISTDLEDPPAFAAVLPARAADHAATADYDKDRLPAMQRRAYPDIAPLYLKLPPNEAFARAIDTAQKMPRWTIIATDPEGGRIEASARTYWMGFTDDVIIRVSPTGDGSRIDMRSLSRQGRGDFGANAARIRTYLAALKAAAG